MLRQGRCAIKDIRNVIMKATILEKYAILLAKIMLWF
jgi:hypothetical protein